MDLPVHSLSDLFEQLGLPGDGPSVAAFIRQYSPLPGQVVLSEAPFWSPTQAQFLRQQWLQDADWVQPVDELNAALRGTGGAVTKISPH